jgi:hypothetical protein
VPRPALRSLELGGERQQHLLTAWSGHELYRAGQPAPETGTDAAGKPARFHAPVIGANVSAVATLRNHDRSP